jgi:hypothetical protein
MTLSLSEISELLLRVGLTLAVIISMLSISRQLKYANAIAQKLGYNKNKNKIEEKIEEKIELEFGEKDRMEKIMWISFVRSAIWLIMLIALLLIWQIF